ncbi:hypothetical protein FWH58_00315 [Candidatus Saccharibacteria bacterium]|nr:hypothetical protein [Candidatus Saccharibacteria bacterium]
MTQTTKLTPAEREEIMQRFTDVWGVDAEIKIAIEEMAELTKELCSTWRDNNKANPEALMENLHQRIREEIADVLVTVGNLRLIFGADKVDKTIDAKLQRGAARLEKWLKEHQ